MRKALATMALSLILWPPTFTFAQSAPPTNIIHSESETLLEAVVPFFSLQATPTDSPSLIQKKAALRLFKEYSSTIGILNTCSQKNPGSTNQTLGDFSTRNNGTFGAVMMTIKSLGGFDKETKTALDTAISAQVMVGTDDCQSFLQMVDSGYFDLDKAPQYATDYSAMRNPPATEAQVPATEGTTDVPKAE